MRLPVQSLWIGPRLSQMERLSIVSFLANGHPFHLYAYDEIEGIPGGTTILDAQQILPRSRIFRYSAGGSLAGFSNFFRYKMLLEKGGWWVDMDTVCLKPFDFDAEYVISSEISRGQTVPDLAALRVPAGSSLAAYAWAVCESKDPGLLRWGETGPRLLAAAVDRCGLNRYIQPPATFCPVDYADWGMVLRPGAPEPGPESFAIHLWNELWRDCGQDKDVDYSPDCVFEKLKSRYLGSNR